MKRSVFFAFLCSFVSTVLLFIGCAPQNAQGADQVQPSQQAVSVPFQVLIRDADMTAWMPYKSLKPEQYLPVTNAQQLATELNLNSMDPSQPFPPAELKRIDFQKEIGLFLTRGLKGRGGYTLEVSKMERQGTTLHIFLHLQDPQGMADSAMHYRVTLLKMARSDLPPGTFDIVVSDQQGNQLSKREVQSEP